MTDGERVEEHSERVLSEAEKAGLSQVEESLRKEIEELRQQLSQSGGAMAEQQLDSLGARGGGLAAVLQDGRQDRPKMVWPSPGDKIEERRKSLLTYIRETTAFCYRDPQTFSRRFVMGLVNPSANLLDSIQEYKSTEDDEGLRRLPKDRAIREVARWVLGVEPALGLKTSFDTAIQQESETGAAFVARLLDLQFLLKSCDDPRFPAPTEEQLRDRIVTCSKPVYQAAVQDLSDRLGLTDKLPSRCEVLGAFTKLEAHAELASGTGLPFYQLVQHLPAAQPSPVAQPSPGGQLRDGAQYKSNPTRLNGFYLQAQQCRTFVTKVGLTKDLIWQKAKEDLSRALQTSFNEPAQRWIDAPEGARKQFLAKALRRAGASIYIYIYIYTCYIIYIYIYIYTCYIIYIYYYKYGHRASIYAYKYHYYYMSGRRASIPFREANRDMLMSPYRGHNRKVTSSRPVQDLEQLEQLMCLPVRDIRPPEELLMECISTLETSQQLQMITAARGIPRSYPSISIKFQEVATEAFLDTMAGANILDKALFDRLEEAWLVQHPGEPFPRTQGSSFQGPQSEVHSSFQVTLPFKLSYQRAGTQEYCAAFHVMEMQGTVKCLLGRPFLQSSRISITYIDDTIEVHVNNQVLVSSGNQEYISEQLLQLVHMGAPQLSYSVLLPVPPDHDASAANSDADVHLTAAQAAQLNSLKAEFSTIFEDITGPPPAREGLQPVYQPLRDPSTAPVCKAPYAQGPREQAAMKQEIEDLLSKGLMRKAQGSEGWGSPMFMVSKTNQADTLLRKVSQGQVFSSLDLTSGFYQIGLDPRTQELATVSTPWGRYSFVVPPMGLASTPSFFQESMDKLFKGLDDCLSVYVDDLCVFSSSVEDHLNDLRRVFQRLDQHQLKVKASKCSFMKHSLQFLGLGVSHNQLRMGSHSGNSCSVSTSVWQDLHAKE
ncbi:putative retroelement pol polyprotein [Chloropicon roscoffensis]|uniref:Retroelement pol polyprotein n=1 Tax=Chloropicon roscoffensis TaxID=1461544 RepID=A0AAX4P4L2_9CHLO